MRLNEWSWPSMQMCMRCMQVPQPNALSLYITFHRFIEDRLCNAQKRNPIVKYLLAGDLFASFM